MSNIPHLTCRSMISFSHWQVTPRSAAVEEHPLAIRIGSKFPIFPDRTQKPNFITCLMTGIGCNAAETVFTMICPEAVFRGPA